MTRPGGNIFALLLVIAIAGGAAFLALRIREGRVEQSAESTAVAATARLREPLANTMVTPQAGAAEAVVAARAEPLRAFEAWTTRYLNETDTEARRRLINEGVAIAERRRRALYELIAADPEAALRGTVPVGVRRRLPVDVERWLEKRIGGVGDLSVLGALPADENPTVAFRPIRREVTIEGQSFDAYVYGVRTGVASQQSIALHGVAIGDRMAVLDGPVRVLEPGETIPAGRVVSEICAVSGAAAGPATVTRASDLIAADTGDRIIYLCSAGHVSALEEELRHLEAGGHNSSEATRAAASANAPAIGNRSLLVIRVRFSNQTPSYEPQTESSVLATVADVNAFFAANSANRFSVSATVTPVYVLPYSASWYSSHDTSGYAKNVLEAARAVAANPAAYPGNESLPTFNYLSYDLEAVRYSTGPGDFSGQAYVGVRGIWLKTSSAGVLAHEMAHNLGLWHANAWIANAPQTVVGPGRNSEYGDVFDSMGRNSGAHWHFNAYEKRRLGWLDEGSITSLDSDAGVRRLHAHDLGGAEDPSRSFALKILRDVDRDLWIEFRQHSSWSSNAALTNGVTLRWDPWLSSNGGTQLLDTTPFTVDGFVDSAVVIGRTFTDPVADLHVTPLARDGTSPISIDVDVRKGPFPDNRAPAVALSASQSNVDPGSAVVLIANASDADGDALAYAWDFGDGSLAVSEPTVEKTWNVAGDRRVRVVVSDRKGRTTAASVIVRIGTPATTTSIVRGAVTDTNGAPVPDVRVHNGLSPYDPGYREALTDAVGTYALVNVPPGSWTLAATQPGWIFARRLFLNPVAVPGDTEGIDFIAHEIGFSVSGTVRGADGEPVPDAIVTAGAWTEPTNASGAFVLRGLPAGRWTIKAEKGGRTFAAAAVDVGYGDVSGITITETTLTLAGIIEGIDPSTPVTVTDGIRSTTSLPQAAAGGAQAVFSLSGVPAGSRHLVAFANGMSFSLVGFSNPIEVATDRTDLVFAKDAATRFHISGRVIADGVGVEGATVTADGASVVTDSSGRYFLTGLSPGDYTVAASGASMAGEPETRAVTIENSPVNGIDFEVELANSPPHFTSEPAANALSGSAFVSLHASADDDGGSTHLRYTWSTVGETEGPVVFSENDTRRARNCVATFGAAGSHRLRVTIVDAHGAIAAKEVVVVVQPTAVRMAVELSPHPIWSGGTAQFSVSCLDQFGAAMVPPASMAWRVSGGGSIDPTGLFTASAAGEDFTVTATAGGLTASATFDVGYPPGPGTGITQEMWTGISGALVANLTSAPSFPSKPNHVAVLAGALETPSGFEHNYGQRLRGYFVPPVSGDYVFFIASDNASELWFSPGSDPSTRTLVASVGTATRAWQWGALSSQQSAPIALVEGRSVYLEVLHKENSSEDHLAVAVRMPGGVFEAPIPAHRLLPWGEPVFAPPTIVVPAAASPSLIGAGLSAEVAVSAASEGGAGGLTYRWEAISGAPGPVVFVPNGSLAARSATARFSRASAYTLRVIVSDSAGQTAESTVEVVVVETQISWRRRFFSLSELDNPALESTRWGTNADPDRDGVANLLEYAFDLDPLVPSVDGLPVVHMVDVDGVEHLAITFRRNPIASDIVYTPQASSDLQSWEGGLIPVGDPAANPATYRDPRPATDFEKRFLRVQALGP